MKKYLLLVFIVIFSISSLSFAQIKSASSGDWSSTATWIGGIIPSSADAVTIDNAHTVTINATGATGATVTINAGGTLNIVGAGGAKFTGNLMVSGTLLINTADSVIVGYTSTGDKKIDLTASSTGVATFTKGTVLVYGKFNTAALNTTTIDGADIIIDAKGSTGYAFRYTTGTGGSHPFTFTSGKISIINPAVTSSNAELAMSASVAPNISGTAEFILGQGNQTVASTAGYRISLNSVAYLNNLKINSGNVGVALLTNVTVNGKLTITSCGALSGAFKWKSPHYIFNGTVSQVTGSIIPDSVKVVEIINSAGVVSSQQLTITDTLYNRLGTLSGPYTARVTVTGGTDVKMLEGLPSIFDLSQNYPNPFNPTTSISFSIPQAEFVSLKIYDILGKEVANLLSERKDAGNYIVSFDASKLSSGVYIYRLSSEKYVISKKMMLIK